MSRASVVAPPIARSFAEVAVPGAWSSAVLTYEIPPEIMDTIHEGSAVWVPLRGKPIQGVVLRVHDSEPEFATHPLIGLTDPPVVLSQTQLRTARWMARETASGLMDTLALFLPPGTTQQTRAYLAVADEELDNSTFTRPQQKLLNHLIERGEISIESARTAMGSSLASVIPALEKAGALQVRHRIVTSKPSVRMEHWVRVIGAPDVTEFEQEAAPATTDAVSLPQGTTQNVTAVDGDAATRGSGGASASPGTVTRPGGATTLAPNGSSVVSDAPSNVTITGDTDVIAPLGESSNANLAPDASAAYSCGAYGDWYDAQVAYENAGATAADPAMVQAMDPDYDGIACEEGMA